jgi:hypothetical protein
MEKSKGLCRQVVIPSVRDALVLQVLSDALWLELRDKAPSRNAHYAPNDHRFSEAIRGQTGEYGPIQAWLSFQETILGFSQVRQYVVVTDIANYYDFISYAHLRNIISGRAPQREHLLDLLIFTLSHMLWQPNYMPRVEVGLPQMELDAPRLLAHCFLFEIDELLVSKGLNADFARYMDDIDIGVDTIADGRAILRDLDLALQTRQVRLNSGKTAILSHPQSRRHFRIRENSFLNKFEISASRKMSSGLLIERERQFLLWAIRRGLRAQAFEDGNGEKILKRLINYARRFSAHICCEDFRTLLLNWPAVRKEILKWWQHSHTAVELLSTIADVLESPFIIDEAMVVNIARALVSARLPDGDVTRHSLARICQHLEIQRPASASWFFARVWVLSKYGSATSLMRSIESTGSFWGGDEYLSRLVGGLYPRFREPSRHTKFSSIVARAGGRWCQQVFDFHTRLSSSAEGFASVRKFVRAQNPSEPNKISHPKFLMLCSMVSNQNVSPAWVDDLRSLHTLALEDDFYRKIIEQQ